MDDDARYLHLEARLAEVEARLAKLEELPRPSDEADGSLEAEAFWALRGLRERLAEQPAMAPAGGVLFTGVVSLPDGEYHEWQQGAFTHVLLRHDWAEFSNAFSALAHPVRLRLLQEVVRGERTVAQLQEHEDMGTSGQIYHHLRQLTASGWLQSSGRGQYTVPEVRVVPLMIALSAMTMPGSAGTGEE